MRPGMQRLLELLRAEGRERAVEPAEWEAALTLAEEERVLRWAAARLRAQEGALPAATLKRLDRIERDAAIAAFYFASELKGLLREFREAEIAVVPLKGPCLAEWLYGSAALRSNRDLDLLVAKAELTRAEALLTALGFVPGVADDYHRPWTREATTVELHHDVENPLAFDFHVASALRRVQPALFQGEPCLRLAPEDELLYLCLHAARHRFGRLSLLLDLRLAFEKLPQSAEVWQPREEAAGMDSLLTLGLAMACRLQPDLGVSPQLRASGRDAPHLERLAGRLWQRLLTQASEPLDWRALHSFYLEIELPGRPRLNRRYRHLQILLGRVIEPDYTFAARFGMQRAWQARMLRPVRLLSGWVRRPGQGYD